MNDLRRNNFCKKCLELDLHVIDTVGGFYDGNKIYEIIQFVPDLIQSVAGFCSYE